MKYNERIQNVSVLGAGGKMGSGILLLTAMEMAKQMLTEGKVNTYTLNAIDTSEDNLRELLKYVETQTTKSAEKNIDQIREWYGKTENDNNLIKSYTDDVLSIIKTTTNIEDAYNSSLIFEVVSENQALKEKLFKQINENSKVEPWFFTNTSSMPIHVLNEGANMKGRILGFHFYNPPAVQKLVELITIPENTAEMIDFAKQYARNLKKIVVSSNDIAGFIGNGHFMRDALYAIAQAEKLSSQMPMHEAIYTMDKVIREYLARPMGMFQLIDYVGLDVVQFILRVMQPYMPNENLHSDLLDQLILSGIKGGQYGDGSPKDGFFKYENGKPVAVLDIKAKHYIPFADFKANSDAWLGEMPTEVKPWKEIMKAENRNNLLEAHFEAIKKSSAKGAQLALDYAGNAKKIGLNLFNNKVAHTQEDVNTVMLTGFFHAYGPINAYV